MLYTSNEANKLLKTYQEQIKFVINNSKHSSTFIAAISENIEEVRPEYNFKTAEVEIFDLQLKVRTLKHAINLFNTSTIVPELNMTVDELLVALPQWNETLNRYAELKNKLPKSRKFNGYSSGSIIEYEYINYNLDDVNKLYTELNNKINTAQIALNTINSTIRTIDITL